MTETLTTRGTTRFRVDVRDVPLEFAARRLGIKVEEFNGVLTNLIARGFPKPDPDTGHFDLVAIDKWCDARHGHLFGGIGGMQARDASTVAKKMRRGSTSSYSIIV